jgi:hypothetical protein
MYSISNKINISKKAVLAKNTFINDETIPSVNTTFTCCSCGHENRIEITPYTSGFPILKVYQEDQVLSGNELLKNGMVSETPKRCHIWERSRSIICQRYISEPIAPPVMQHTSAFSAMEKSNRD